MFVTALLAVSLAAPVPKVKPPLYFPTVEGTKRVMQKRPGGRNTETTETATKVVEKEGKYTVTISFETPGRADEFEYEVSEKGVFALPRDGEKGEPRALLKLPAKEGNTWTTEQTVRGNTTVTTYTVGKEEVMEVPAGKFTAIPVTAEVNLNGTSLKTTSWYAAGVGVVKSVNESNRGHPRWELKQFTPGKAK